MSDNDHQPSRLIDPDTGKVSELIGHWEDLGYVQGLCTKDSREINADGAMTVYADVTVGTGQTQGRIAIVFKDDIPQVRLEPGYEYRIHFERLSVCYRAVE